MNKNLLCVLLLASSTAAFAQGKRPDTPVTGTVSVTQGSEWLVREVGETYTDLIQPTCDFSNRCLALFPIVPQGYYLRVTNITGAMFTAVQGFVALRIDAVSGDLLFMLAVPPLGAAYLGNVGSFNEQTDVVFTAGHMPVLEFGKPADAVPLDDPRNRLGITATLIPID